MRTGVMARAYACAIAVVALAACSGSEFSGVTHANASPVAQAAPAVAPPTRALPDFSALVERVGPAVVNVSTVRAPETDGNSNGAQSLPPGAENDPFFEFFRRFGVPFDMPQPSPTMGLGSGFIISQDGYILTNAHVVKGATEVTVKLTDRREFKAKVVGSDAFSDVATLKIEATGLPTVKIGDPDKVKVGDWVAAIGSPFGFENSVTAGIESAKSRSLPDEGYVPFIQTDVAINPGNSGGPLLNLKGEVVGINSQIYSRSGGYQGLSFAIPINVAAKVKDDILAHGKVTRGRIGIAIQDVNQALAESFGLPKPEGALVSSVEKGSPGEKAGLKVGDVILGLNGTPIKSSAELPPKVAEVKPGTAAKLEVWRKGETRQISVTVGEAQPEKIAANDDNAAAGGKLGLSVRPLSPEEQREAETQGLLVLDTAGAAV